MAAGQLGSGAVPARVVAAAGRFGMGAGPLATGVVRAGLVARRRAGGVGGDPTVRRGPGPCWFRNRDGGSHAPRPRHGRPEAAPPAGDGHRRRWLLPTVQRTERRLRPRGAPDRRGAGRRRLGRQRPEGVDVGRPGRQQGDAGRTHERGRAQAHRDLLLPRPHGPARHRGSSPARDDRPQVLQRSVHHRRPRARAGPTSSRPRARGPRRSAPGPRRGGWAGGRWATGRRRACTRAAPGGRR